MEAVAGVVMQSRVVGIEAGPSGRWDAVLGGCGEKWVRTGTLRIGGPAGVGTPAVAVRARRDKPVASLCCHEPSRECDETGEPNIEPQFLGWVGKDMKCPYCEGLGSIVCDVCEGKTVVES